MTVAGGGLDSEFKLLQLHFHWRSDGKKFGNGGSEHLINSIRYWGELHIVTANSKYPDNHTAYPDGLAVLGFFVDVRSYYS